jgi:hypothetical protein
MEASDGSEEFIYLGIKDHLLKKVDIELHEKYMQPP